MKKITSVQHVLVKELCGLHKTEQRYQTGRTLVFTQKLIQEIESELDIQLILVPLDWEVDYRFPTYAVSPHILEKITRIPSFEDMIAVVSIPQRPLLQYQRIVISDGIADPGNLGTVLRTALAFGWDGVFLLPGSADPFSDKVIRASRGAVFRLPIRSLSYQQLFDLYREQGGVIVGAEVGGIPYTAYTPPSKFWLALGNEGRGLTQPVREQSRDRVSIPIAIESLNVAAAAAILLARWHNLTSFLNG